MWPKVGNSSISITEVTITSIFYRFDKKNEEAKDLKLKIRGIWGPITTFVEVTAEKLEGFGFLLPYPPPPFPLILNTNKVRFCILE